MSYVDALGAVRFAADKLQKVGLFQTEHLDALRQSGAWFARKFPVEPQAAVRQQVLRDLVGMAHGPALSESAA